MFSPIGRYYTNTYDDKDRISAIYFCIGETKRNHPLFKILSWYGITTRSFHNMYNYGPLTLSDLLNFTQRYPHLFLNTKKSTKRRQFIKEAFISLAN